MSVEPHRIGRVALAVSADDLGIALDLRPRIEALAWRAMPEVMERVCDALIPADVHLRIDRLYLDLGGVDPDALESDVLAALELTFKAAVEQKLAEAGFDPESGRNTTAAHRLDHFETYLVNGRLPFGGTGFDAADRLRELIEIQPEALIAMLKRRAGAQHFLTRLVLQVDEIALKSLLSLLAPGDAATILALLGDVLIAHRLAPVAAAVPVSEPALGRILWVATFEFLLRDAGSQFNRRRFLEHLLRREAARSELNYNDLLRLLADAVAAARDRTGFRSSLPIVLADLLGERPRHDDAATPPPPDDSAAAALAAARAGDFVALILLVRRLAGDRVALTALVRELDKPLFAGLIHQLEPGNADAILAILDDLVATHGAAEIPGPPAGEVEQRLRAVTLRYLLNDAGSQFNRRRFLARLLQEAAESAGMDYPFLLRMMADVVDRVRLRTGVRSSLPAVLADLVGELPIDQDAPNESADALIVRLRAMVARGEPIGWLLGRIDVAMLRQVMEHLVPGMAADVDEMVVLYGRSPWLSISGVGFSRHLFERIINALIVSRQQLERRERIRWIIARVAEGAGVTAPVVRDVLARALVAVPGARTALGAELAREQAAVRSGSVAADNPAATIVALVAAGDFASAAGMLRTAPAMVVAQLARMLGAREQTGLLAALAGSAATAVRDGVAELARAHREAALLPVDAARFAAMLWSVAVGYLAGLKGAAFDRVAFAHYLAEAVAAQSDDRPAIRSRVRPERLRAGESDDRARVESFLRGSLTVGGGAAAGDASEGGAALPRLATGDARWLAATIRRLARATPEAMPALLARLLDWLLPEELLACLIPDAPPDALRWARDLSGDAGTAWAPIFAAVVRDEMPDFVAAAGRDGPRIAPRTALVAWVHGEAMPPDASDAAAWLAALSLTELTALFQSNQTEHSIDRLARVVALLGQARGSMLLERLAPWAMRSDGALATMLAGLDARRRGDVLIRAAAMAVNGSTVDLSQLALPVPPPAPVASPSPQGETIDDPARLFAWLDGAAESGTEAAALLRLFARLADTGDARLADYVAARRTDAGVRARWIAVLPPEALAPMVALLVPGGSRVLIDTMLLIGTAWRQMAPFGARRPDPAALWSLLFEAIAVPGRVDVPRVIGGLVEQLTAKDATQAARLRDQTQRLARDGGYKAVSAALRRSTAIAAPKKATAPRRSAARDAKTDSRADDLIDALEDTPPDEPGGTIYIGNAGLVLLGPYLPVLFERLGVLSLNDKGKQRIVGLEAMSRAVHLLQYCAEGRLDAPEPELVLNKLLCGLPTAQPVERAIEPVQADLDICDGLLGAVIANWPAIGNVSVAALQETFLQRDGRLLRGDGDWTLTVQRKTLDVLTDQIPWGFAMIFHRWMTDPVKTTW